jgi:hypothetical protein
VIYCVVPEALSGELFDKLTDYYADDPGVTVIIERRKSSRRAQAKPGAPEEARSVRDRRRARVVGELPEVPPAGE